MNVQPKPKRGAEYTHIETGQTLYLNRIVDRCNYLMCEQQSQGIEDKYINVDPKLLKPAKSAFKPIVSKPKVLTDKEKTETQKLNEFYTLIGLKMPFNCEECGVPLYAYNKFAKRSCSCHILPKAYFPSVAINEDNIIFMGAGFLGNTCNHHDVFDSNIDARIKMKIYPLVLERFEKLKPHLTNSELIKAYTYLNIKWQ